MRFYCRTLLLLVTAFALLSCSGPQIRQTDLSQVRKTIEQTNAKFVAAYNQGDAAGVAELYTADAYLLPPNSVMIQGREGVEGFWSGAMEMGLREPTLTTVDVGGSGDTVYEIGKYTVTIQTDSQPAARDSGKYVVVWKEQTAGSWLMQADIWNSSVTIAMSQQ